MQGWMNKIRQCIRHCNFYSFGYCNDNNFEQADKHCEMNTTASVRVYAELIYKLSLNLVQLNTDPNYFQIWPNNSSSSGKC